MTVSTRVSIPRRVASAAGRGFVACALLACALLAARPVEAQILRVGYVDSQRIFEQYTDALDAQSRFQREITAWKSEADDRHKQLDALRNELKDQEAILSEAKRLEKESALQKAVSDYDKFVQDFWAPGGKVERSEPALRSYELVVQVLAIDAGHAGCPVRSALCAIARLRARRLGCAFGRRTTHAGPRRSPSRGKRREPRLFLLREDRQINDLRGDLGVRSVRRQHTDDVRTPERRCERHGRFAL